MESIGLEMEDIFGEEVDVNEDVGAVQNVAESTENPDDENTFDANLSAKLDKGAAKKVVRNPQPKLDPQRLAGERGIAILPKLFEKVKFKGKGFEAQDLEKVIKGLEHWAHRLFPKRTFEECLERIEKLGNKREVKTCIKKIRLDMPILDEDFVSKPEENVENPDIGAMNEITEAEQAFDQMMQTSTPRNSQTSLSQMNTNGQSKTVLSDELKEKIERNRRLALERRAQKLQAQNLQNSKDLPSVSSAEDKEKQSQCQDSVVEPSNDAAKIITQSGNNASVDSTDGSDGREQLISFDEDGHQNIDSTTLAETNKGSQSSVDDKLHSDEKNPFTPTCEEYGDTGKNVNGKSSPIKKKKNIISDDDDDDNMHSNDKTSLTPTCEEYDDTDKNVDKKFKKKKNTISDYDDMHSNDKTSFTPTCEQYGDTGKNVVDKKFKKKKNIISDDDDMHSNDKTSFTPTCEQYGDTGKNVVDKKFKKKKNIISDDDDDDMHSNDKTSFTPTCEQYGDTGKNVVDKKFKKKKNIISDDDDDDMHSNDKTSLTPTCEEYDDTDKNVLDNSSPIKKKNNTISTDDDDMYLDDKTTFTPTYEEYDNTDKNILDNSSPIKKQKNTISDDDMHLDDKTSFTPTCKEYSDTGKNFVENNSPIKNNVFDDNMHSDEKISLTPTCKEYRNTGKTVDDTESKKTMISDDDMPSDDKTHLTPAVDEF